MNRHRNAPNSTFSTVRPSPGEPTTARALRSNRASMHRKWFLRRSTRHKSEFDGTRGTGEPSSANEPHLSPATGEASSQWNSRSGLKWRCSAWLRRFAPDGRLGDRRPSLGSVAEFRFSRQRAGAGARARASSSLFSFGRFCGRLAAARVRQCGGDSRASLFGHGHGHGCLSSQGQTLDDLRLQSAAPFVETRAAQ